MRFFWNEVAWRGEGVVMGPITAIAITSTMSFYNLSNINSGARLK